MPDRAGEPNTWSPGPGGVRGRRTLMDQAHAFARDGKLKPHEVEVLEGWGGRGGGDGHLEGVVGERE